MSYRKEKPVNTTRDSLNLPAVPRLALVLVVAVLLATGCQPAQPQAEAVETSPPEEPNQFPGEEAMTAETPSTQASIEAYLGDAFSMPVVSPMLERPPFRYADTQVTAIVFKTDPEVLAKLVPPPLEPNPDQLMLFYIGHFLLADYGLAYNEAGLGVPVIYNGKPGYYAIVLYLDQPNPIVGGREIYGWPKKEAEKILYQEEDGKVTAEVTRYGFSIIKATFETTETLDPVPERPKDPWYLLKLIPSLEEGAPPDVLKLYVTVMDPDVATEMNLGTATLEFSESPYDAFLSEIPVGEIVYGETIVHDFTLGYGELVRDYLAEEQQ
jgi:acetoacetate decarboxylase